MKKMGKKEAFLQQAKSLKDSANQKAAIEEYQNMVLTQTGNKQREKVETVPNKLF